MPKARSRPQASDAEEQAANVQVSDVLVKIHNHTRWPVSYYTSLPLEAQAKSAGDVPNGTWAWMIHDGLAGHDGNRYNQIQEPVGLKRVYVKSDFCTEHDSWSGKKSAEPEEQRICSPECFAGDAQDGSEVIECARNEAANLPDEKTEIGNRIWREADFCRGAGCHNVAIPGSPYCSNECTRANLDHAEWKARRDDDRQTFIYERR